MSGIMSYEQYFVIDIYLLYVLYQTEQKAQVTN